MAVTNPNFLQPTNFKLIIDRVNYPNLEYFVQGVQHPSVSLTPPTVSYKRIAEIPFTGDKLEFGEVTLSIILDENMSAYIEMFDWMHRLVQNKTVKQSEATTTKLADTRDITLVILSSTNNIIKKIVYRDAIPTNLGDIYMEASMGDTTPVVVPVSFNYAYFDIV